MIPDHPGAVGEPLAEVGYGVEALVLELVGAGTVGHPLDLAVYPVRVRAVVVHHVPLPRADVLDAPVAILFEMIFKLMIDWSAIA